MAPFVQEEVERFVRRVNYRTEANLGTAHVPYGLDFRLNSQIRRNRRCGEKRPIGHPMNKSLFGFGITALILSVASVSGQQLGTVDQARAMLDRAISALKSNEATALSEFNDPNNKQFHERDLYVFCYDISDGKITAYESPALLNIDVRTLALQDDPIGKRAYDAIENAREGSIVTIDYKFPKPGTTEPVPKQTLETRIGNQACGVTSYK